VAYYGEPLVQNSFHPIVVYFTSTVVLFTTMKNAEILNGLFSSKLRVMLLDVFMSSPDSRLYAREISRKIRADATNVCRELNKLESIGLLISERQGPLKYYSTNRNFFLFPELKAMIFKTTGVLGALRNKLENIPGIEIAFVYGSYASGTETKDSDIDVLIIGRPNISSLNDALEALEARLDREVNYLCFERGEFDRKKKNKDPFIADVLAGTKSFILGDPDGIY
jgi:predicted nucleotidyltransferase